MNSKHEAIRVLTARLMRITSKHMRIEETPIRTGKNTGLTAREVHCLTAVGQREGINIKGLGEALGVTKSAASQMIARLEKKDFVTKERALDSDKEIRVLLTRDGWRAFEAHKEFHERHLETLARRLDEFPDTQLAMASAILAVVETVVDDRMAELFGR